MQARRRWIPPPGVWPEVLTELCERSRRLYPDERRRIVAVQVLPEGGSRCRVEVASME